MTISPSAPPYSLQLQRALDDGYEVKPFPAVVNQLVQELRNPHAKTSDFSAIIEQDIALAARILRLANSPIYGFPRVLKSVRHAVTALGSNVVRSMALSYAGAKMFSTQKVCLQREKLWKHSLACAMASRFIADLSHAIPDDGAFLAGMLHDVGKLLFIELASKEYSAILTGHSSLSLHTEQRLFGTGHEEVGFRLIAAWPLPDMVKSAIRYHHQPDKDDQPSKLTSIVHVADYLVRSRGIACRADELATVEESAMHELGLEETDLDVMARAISRVFNAAINAFA